MVFRGFSLSDVILLHTMYSLTNLIIQLHHLPLALKKLLLILGTLHASSFHILGSSRKFQDYLLKYFCLLEKLWKVLWFCAFEWLSWTCCILSLHSCFCRGGWTITGTPLNLQDPRLLAIAEAERNLLEAEYDEYAASDASGAAFCRAAALIVSLLFDITHKRPNIIIKNLTFIMHF